MKNICAGWFGSNKDVFVYTTSSTENGQSIITNILKSKKKYSSIIITDSNILCFDDKLTHYENMYSEC